MEPVHIREAYGRFMCEPVRGEFVAGGSIGLDHYQEQPAHVASLVMCPACVQRADQIPHGQGGE